MTYYDYNFSYLKNTELDEFYKDMLKAECMCRSSERISRIITAQVIEKFVRKLAAEKNISDKVSAGKLINILKDTDEKSISDGICRKIQLIRENASGIFKYDKKEEKSVISAEKILEYSHDIFVWYLNKKISYKESVNIDLKKEELKRLNLKLLKYETEISNLREMLINMASSRDAREHILGEIEKVKKESKEFEDEKITIEENIRYYYYIAENTEKNFDREINNIDLAREACINKHRTLSNKESLLIRGELDYKKINQLFDELDEFNEKLKEENEKLKSEIKDIRKIYEEEIRAENEFQDIIITLLFLKDEEVYAALMKEKDRKNNKISDCDKEFYVRAGNYASKIRIIENDISVFKTLSKEKLRNQIKYREFYNGFLNIKGEKLRYCYAVFINWSKINGDMISKTKEFLTKGKVNSFVESVNKTLRELKDITDDQIKLVLYYKLIKISERKLNNICNEKQFINALDNMVECAIGTLMHENQFEFDTNNIKTIKIFYITKILERLKNRFKNIEISDENILAIYNMLVNVYEENKINFSMIKDFDINNVVEINEKIKKDPFTYLIMITKYGYNEELKLLQEITYNMIRRELNMKDISYENVNKDLLRLKLFILGTGEVFDSTEPDGFIPIFAGEIFVSREFNNREEIDFGVYDNLVSLWRKLKASYDDKVDEKNRINNEIDNFNRQKEKLAESAKNLSKSIQEIAHKKDLYIEEFKSMVLNSEEAKRLPSYDKFKEVLEKIKGEENKKQPSTVFENILNHATKMLGSSAYDDLEEKLVNEARNDLYFAAESQNIENMENELRQMKEELKKFKDELEQTEKQYKDKTEKVKQLDKYVSALKDMYSNANSRFIKK